MGPRGPLVPDEDMGALRRATTLTIKSWGITIGMTLLLMDRLSSIVSADILSTDNNTGVPFILAFLTAFYTPQVGISCRTLTISVYTITQLCQIILWLWVYAGAPEEGACPHILRKGGFIHRTGFYTPTDISSLRSRETLFTLSSLWSVIWYTPLLCVWVNLLNSL